MADVGPVTHGDLGDVLAVFAHPDDEAYLAGALMACAADAGRRVVCVTATRGELGFPDDDRRSPAERKQVREAELAACLEVLGVREHRWLDYPDGGCAELPDDQPVERLAAMVDEVRPHTVLTFGPDGQTFHDDHISVGRWTTLAVDAAAHSPQLLYAAMTPDWVAMFGEVVPLDQILMVPGAQPQVHPPDELAVWFRADGALLDRKVRALRCQASQVEPLVAQTGVEMFAELTRDEMFREPVPGDWS